MSKKIYNNIIAILLIAIIGTIILIVIRYGRNYENEKDISKTLDELEQKLENLSDSNQNIDMDFKGYKIEGIIEIPAINIKYPIINQTNDDAMKYSITKFYGPQPNEIGNYVVAGHNNRDGTMFGKTKFLKVGDIIKITNLKNETVEYEIYKIYSIDPNDVSCLDSSEDNIREVTLITCTNGHKQRLITKAKEKTE